MPDHIATEPCPFCRKPVKMSDEYCVHCGEQLYEDDVPRSRPRGPGDASAEQGLKWLIPIGRSGWSIAAGYLGLLSCIPMVGLIFGASAVVTGILGIQHSSRNPALGGRGRAIFGIAPGGLNFVLNLIAIILYIAWTVSVKR